MKKLICTLLIACILLSFAVPFVTAEENSRVEISFRVGDSTLKINGTDVAVETPYVVGEGVTLVPLRVITEAFGATVGWEGETQTITLDYPGVNIILQIGNPIAEVNGRAETLLAAPELPGSSTMVPLRFISETFGATVSYDEATEAILVIKEKTAEESTLVSGIDSKYIGDSYYGWSMENPLDMQMEERRFDGLFTAFTAGKDALLTIVISYLPKDYDFNRDFNDAKTSLADYTLVMADKFEDTKSMHLQGRTKEQFIDMYRYVTDKYCFTLLGAFSNENQALRNEMVRVLSTFKASYAADAQMHDLSTVEGEWRLLEDNTYNFTMKIPADYMLYDATEVENEYTFLKSDENDSISGVSFGIYSKSSTVTAHLLALKDYEILKKNMNEKVTTFSAFNQGTHGTLPTYEFTATVSGSHKDDFYMKQFFWEVGDYVYNLTVELAMPFEEPAAFANTIMDSMQANPIDAEKVGTLLRNDAETEGFFVSSPSTKDWSLTIPNTYVETRTPVKGAAAYGYKNGFATLYYDVTQANGASTKHAMAALSASVRTMKGEYDSVVVTEKPAEKRLGSKYYAWDEVSFIQDGQKMYVRRYVFAASGNEYHQFSLYTTEMYRSKGIIEEAENIISTLAL